MGRLISRRHFLQTVPPTVIGVVLVPACRPTDTTTSETEGGTLTRAREFEIDDFNPLTFLSTVQELVLQYSMNKLVTWNKNLTNIEPDLAESWDISDDGRTYTFRLRKDVTWHDGKPLSVDDVTFTYLLALNKDTTSRFMEELAGISGAKDYSAGKATTVPGIKVVDANTVAFELDAADPLFINYTAHVCILPKHLLESIPPKEFGKSDYATKRIVGTGAYEMVKFVPGQFVEWKANANYFRGKPNITRVFLRFVDAGALSPGIQRGEVDLATVPPREAASVAEDPDLDVRDGPTNIPILVFFNLQTIPDVRVRQAIMHAIDRDTMIDKQILHPAASTAAADTFLGHPWLGVSPNLTKYPYDPDKAKALLQEAEWDSSRKLRLVTFNELEPTYVAYQQYLSEVGIETELSKVEITVFPELFYEKREFDLAIDGKDYGLDPDDTKPLLVSNGEQNAMGYSNPRLDELYATGRTMRSEADRIEVYQEIQEILSEDLPVGALGIATVKWAVKKIVHGAFFAEYAASISEIEPEKWSIERQ